MNDDNKREVLGDVIHQIRFPVISLDDFFQTVANSDVLSAAEALDVALTIKNYTPRNKVSFSNKPREGTWIEKFFTGVQLSTSCTKYNSTHQFYLSVPAGNVLISSMYFLNLNNDQNLTMSLNKTAGTIHKLENRSHEGHQLYECTFDSPVTLTAGYAQFSFLHCSGYCTGSGYCTQIRGATTLTHKDITFTPQNNPWFYIVGLKFKKGSISKDVHS